MLLSESAVHADRSSSLVRNMLVIKNLHWHAQALGKGQVLPGAHVLLPNKDDTVLL